MRKILLTVVALALAIAVFCVARHMDSTPMEHGYETRPPMQLDGYEPTLAEPTLPVTEAALATEAPEIPGTEAASEETAAETAGEPQPQESTPETVPAATEPVVTEPEETEPVETVPPYTGPGGERYVLSFAGDCTLGSNLNHAYNGFGFFKTVNGDAAYPFANVKTFFENDDYTLVNLEGPLCVGGNPAVKEHVFRGDPAFVNILAENGVEFANLANNHAMDYGNIGYAETKENLETAGIAYVERDTTTIITTESGLTVGIYGSVYYLMEEEVIAKEISKLRRTGVDLIIFAPHWGSENSYVTTDDQVKLAHAAIDAGADVVYGTHPHVLQPMEEYNGGVIFYSLGNFCFGGNIYPKDFDTALIQLEVVRQADGTVTLGETTIIPACVSSDEARNNYQPTLYEEGSEGYTRVLQKLSGTFR